MLQKRRCTPFGIYNHLFAYKTSTNELLQLATSRDKNIRNIHLVSTFENMSR